MARNFFWIFTENKPVRGLRKKYNIPDVNWLRNTTTENDWLIYAAATVIWPNIMWDILYSPWMNLKLALRFHALLIMAI